MDTHISAAEAGVAAIKVDPEMPRETSSASCDGCVPRGPSVLGAGLMRSGTNSMLLALEQLLGGRCYHMSVVLGERQGDIRLWVLAAKEGLTPEVADQLLGDFAAAVDFPACLFYRELAEIYPDARFILTVRDPRAWAASFRETIMQSAYFTMSAPARWLLGAGHMMEIRRVLMEDHFGLRMDMSDAELASLYERHNAAVRRALPRERLLEFNVAEGWQPLCQFLGVPEPLPDFPFPRVNDTAAFRDRRRQLLRTARAIDFGLGALGAVAALLAGVCILWRRL